MLDACRQSMSEEYSVHLAKSGKEALSALGDTPIDFIVSAHGLPGMSGAEALREAHKRSPETVGILLAGPEMDASEMAALAGSEQIFQVLRGGNTPDEIRTIVANAAGKSKMAKLRDSANDSVANAPRLRPEPFMSDLAPDDARDEPFIATVADLPTAGMRTHAGGRQIEVLILSQDPHFIKSIEDAASVDHTVHHAPTLHEAIDILGIGRVGVLVTDAAVAPSDVEIITQRLREIQPSLVTIVAGRRDDGEELMGLIATGTIYRFLLKPVSAGRARLAIEASVKKSLEYREVPPERPRTQIGRSTVLALARNENNEWNIGRLAAAAGVLLAVLGLAMYLFSGDSTPEQESQPTLADEIIQAPVPDDGAVGSPTAAAQRTGDQLQDEIPDPEVAQREQEPGTVDAPGTEFVAPAPSVEEFRRRAFRALADGRIAMPPEDNALSLYASAMLANPGADGLQAEFDNAIGEALALTERALIEGELGAADELLARIREVHPYESRLPFLEAQLRKEQRSSLLVQARSTAADGDVSGALAILDDAEAFAATPDPMIAAAREELLAARDSMEIDKLLEYAGDRLKSGRLTSPREDSARYYFQTILARDPENQAAIQGLGFVAASLLTNAGAALEERDFDKAETLLSSAKSTGADSDAVDELQKSIDAERELAAAAAAEGDASGTAPEPLAETDSPTDSSTRVAAAVAVPSEGGSMSDPADIPDESSANGELFALQPGTPESALDDGEVGPEPAASDSPTAGAGAQVEQVDLVRTNYVQPVFPRAALRRGRSGWVDLEFTVNEQGAVSEIEVLESNSGTTFNKAAVSALSKWEYEPVIENGVAVPRRARIRIQFNLAE